LLLQVCVRFLNADKKFAEILNSYFTTNLEKNEEIIRRFVESGDFFEEEDDDGGGGGGE
jgi:hypothetical protein